jgi:hypothetical protein
MQRRRYEPTEIIIRSASSLLAIIIGIALAFALWRELRYTPAPELLAYAVVALSAGLGLVAIAVPRGSAKLFLIFLAASLTVAFFTGGPAFKGIVS